MASHSRSNRSPTTTLQAFGGPETLPTDLVTISADDDFDTVAGRVGVGDDEQLRTSARREQYLEGFARITTNSNVELMSHPNRSDTIYDDDGTLIIRISSRRHPQDATDISDKVFDLICQEAITIHEIGHVLYSDFDALNEEVTAIDNEHVQLFFQFVNPLEDGAIEAQLRGRFNVDAELRVLYSNVAPSIEHGTSTHDGSYTDQDGVIFTFHEATIQTLYDMTTFDTGKSTRLIDPDDDEYHFLVDDDRSLFIDFLPSLNHIVAKTISEPDGAKRMSAVGRFFRTVYLPYLDQAAVAGVDQAGKKAEDGEAGGRIGSDIDWSSVNDSAVSGGETAMADKLPTRDELDELFDGSIDDVDDPSITSVVGGFGDSDVGQNGEDDNVDGPNSGDEMSEPNVDREAIEEQLEADYRDEIRQEAAEAADGMLDEVETMHGLLGAHEELEDLQLVVEQREEPDLDRWREVERWGERYAPVLERRLRRQHRSKPKRQQRTGSIDTRRLMDAIRGYARIFRQENQPDKRDYSCLIVQDRSTSMSTVISECEAAVGSFAYALEQVGVDVSVLDFAYGAPRLTLPFGSSVADRRAELLSGVSGGGTPLSEVVALGRRRLDMQSGTPFMMIVTDDKPASPEKYQEQLDSCTFPVIGVSLCPDGDPESIDHTQFFHRSKVVTETSDLFFDLHQLAEEVLL